MSAESSNSKEPPVDRQLSGLNDPRVVAVLKHAREMDEEMRRNPPPPLTEEERLLGEHMQWG